MNADLSNTHLTDKFKNFPNWYKKMMDRKKGTDIKILNTNINKTVESEKVLRQEINGIIKGINAD